MTKPGRNEPCHCGSGLKYKKCCEQKDQQAALTESKYQSIYSDFSADDIDDDWRDVDDREEDDTEDDSDEWSEEDEDEGEVDEGDDDDYKDPHDIPYPQISDAEEELVDKWWDVYRKTDDLDEIKAHLDSFIATRPDLVENLELEHEVLFELSAQYRRAGRHAEFFSFLKSFRLAFPSVYSRSAGYYDFELICWLIGQNRRDEIGQYLNYFIEQPIRNYEQLSSLLTLMLATNVVEEVVPLLMKVSDRILRSRRIYTARTAVQPLIDSVMSVHAKEKMTEEDVKKFLLDVDTHLPLKLLGSIEDIAIWLEIFEDCNNPIQPLPSKLPTRNAEFEDLVLSISTRFASYIRTTTGISWMAGRFYGNALFGFLLSYWKTNRSKKDMLRFTHDRTSKTIASLSHRRSVYEDYTTYMATVNALYYFAGYLRECGNIDTEQMQAMLEMCRILWKTQMESDRLVSVEADCFLQFPSFG